MNKNSHATTLFHYPLTNLGVQNAFDYAINREQRHLDEALESGAITRKYHDKRKESLPTKFALLPTDADQFSGEVSPSHVLSRGDFTALDRSHMLHDTMQKFPPHTAAAFPLVKNGVTTTRTDLEAMTYQPTKDGLVSSRFTEDADAG